VSDRPAWLSVTPGGAPLVLSLPHTGLDLPEPLAARVASPWLARKDADWWVDRLYDFAGDFGATVIRTAWSRTLIDVNRDPSGVSLYPGQATTELCPLTTFDGERLYAPGADPDEAERARRLAEAFEPYHAALAAEIQRLRARYARVVVYDAHSIRSIVPRLFAGELPHFNIGTNDGASCDPALTEDVARACARRPFSQVVNGRFKGGYITRQCGQPAGGVHAIQMELACRTYLKEPLGPVSADTWPVAYDARVAEPARRILRDVLTACLAFASAGGNA
jgi:N-formylglutamate deformylase